MSRFFRLYEILGPLLLTPLALWAWLRHYRGDWALAGLAVAIPILHAYIVPGIGTNVLKMWAFTTKFRIGRFRPQHGFVFGGATALITLACIGAPNSAPTLFTILASAAGVGAVLFFVNWVYDALALKHGVLEVYNQLWADGAGSWAVAAEYSIWFFGLFGFVFGAGLRMAEGVLLAAPNVWRTLEIGGLLLAATVSLPTLCYVAVSKIRHGHSGCRPCVRMPKESPSP